MTKANVPVKDDIADGAYHLTITVVLTIPTFVISVAATLAFDWPWYYAMLPVFGCGILGLVMGPDLDQNGLNINETILMRIPIIGWLIGGFWYTFWYPYGWAFKHRGHGLIQNSHTPVLGTIVRVLYLVLMASAFLVIFTVIGLFILNRAGAEVSGVDAIEIIKAPFLLVQESALPLLLVSSGLLVSDLGHLARDFWGLQLRIPILLRLFS